MMCQKTPLGSGCRIGLLAKRAVFVVDDAGGFGAKSRKRMGSRRGDVVARPRAERAERDERDAGSPHVAPKAARVLHGF